MTLDVHTHKIIMTKILLALVKDSLVGSSIGFKWWTCAMFFYDLPRMSVDLDFDLIEWNEEDIYDRVTEILKPFGTIHDMKNKHFILFRDVIYAENNRHIKIEISKRWARWMYVSRNFMGEQIRIMTKQDMFTHKLIALLHRSSITNRDIFDIRFFLQDGVQANTILLEELADIQAEKYLQQVKEFILWYDFRKVLYGLWELLDEKQKRFAKTKMKDQILWYLDML